ncbi:brachyurin-like [Tenebrio molitor]|uniref:brachyurin-like n=1 Tax=Tenebrio molitor TaxID=7067 RepID=UPI0036249B4F
MPTIDNVATTAIGWGQTSDDNAGIVNELNYVTVTTISNAECQLTYSNTIFDTMICVAGNYNEGPCRGDSGSPLLLTLNHHHWTVGVASFISSNGCESTDPSGYTRILPYVDWIKTTAEIV